MDDVAEDCDDVTEVTDDTNEWLRLTLDAVNEKQDSSDKLLDDVTEHTEDPNGEVVRDASASASDEQTLDTSSETTPEVSVDVEFVHFLLFRKAIRILPHGFRQIWSSVPRILLSMKDSKMLPLCFTVWRMNLLPHSASNFSAMVGMTCRHLPKNRMEMLNSALAGGH